LSPALEATGVRQPYLLYWGGTIPRKRLDWAIRVVDGLGNPGVQLVLCGVERSAHEQIRAGLSPELRQRVCLAPFIAEADLPRLYQNAAAVLYPTLYEGFGFPALEAQAVGTPVLFSRLGSLAELVGPAAITLPPNDLSAWQVCCRALAAERGMTPMPVEDARRWASTFSWDVYAERTVNVYGEVLRHARQTQGCLAAVRRPSAPQRTAHAGFPK
jgi:glycosyltransferase involved in cell wall biosynthesis